MSRSGTLDYARDPAALTSGIPRLSPSSPNSQHLPYAPDSSKSGAAQEARGDRPPPRGDDAVVISRVAGRVRCRRRPGLGDASIRYARRPPAPRNRAGDRVHLDAPAHPVEPLLELAASWGTLTARWTRPRESYADGRGLLASDQLDRACGGHRRRKNTACGQAPGADGGRGLRAAPRRGAEQPLLRPSPKPVPLHQPLLQRVQPR